MMKLSRRDAVLGVGASVGLLTLGSRGALSQSLKKASGAVPAFITNYCPPVVAFEKGYFKDEGLDFQVASSGASGAGEDAPASPRTGAPQATGSRVWLVRIPARCWRLMSWASSMRVKQERRPTS